MPGDRFGDGLDLDPVHVGLGGGQREGAVRIDCDRPSLTSADELDAAISADPRIVMVM